MHEGKRGSMLVDEEGALSRVEDWLDRLGTREVETQSGVCLGARLGYLVYV